MNKRDQVYGCHDAGRGAFREDSRVDYVFLGGLDIRSA